MAEENGKLSFIPLGGLGEIGKNMFVVKYGSNLLVVDCGLLFPEDELLGIDVVIPDASYLFENRHLLRGFVLTHGHEDHLGALSYFLPDLNVPVYGTKLTLGLLQGKLRENGLQRVTKLHEVKPREAVRIGPFKVEFIRVSHSIADAVAVAISTPAGVVVYTGDFKFDQTPVDGEVTDFYKLAQLGENGVLVLLSDSTNAEQPGYTPSERAVGFTLEETFQKAPGRIIVTSFASNIHRLQQIINVATKYRRKVTVVGKSMVNIVNIASELGYLTIPKGMLIGVEEINRFSKNQVVILTTGSQGEPMSALSRIATAEHRQLEIIPGDTVIISATPIPGKERTVARVVDQLFRQGANVITEAVAGVHASGHASQEELKLMLNLIRPRFFVPVHGEYRMLIRHAQLAEEIGIPRENIFILENGQVLEFVQGRAHVAGRVAAGQVLVDGLGVGDVGSVVLRDRKQLAQDGILVVVIAFNRTSGTVVAGPDLVSRGFVYVRESEALMEEARERVKRVLAECEKRTTGEWGTVKAQVREALGKFLYEKTGRRPMILPVTMEV